MNINKKDKNLQWSLIQQFEGKEFTTSDVERHIKSVKEVKNVKTSTQKYVWKYEMYN